MPELPPPIPPHLQPHEPEAAPTLVGVDYRVRLLDDPATNNGCVMVLLSLMALMFLGSGLIVILSRSTEAAGMILSFASLILMFLTFYASLPIWVGLGTSPTVVRILITVLLCIPFFLGAFEGFLSGVLAQVIFSVPFWMMRLFRWRIKSANQLTISTRDRSEVHFIPVRQTSREIEAYVRRHMQSTTPDGPLDAFRPAQFSIMQIFAFTTVFGIVVAFLRLAQEYLSFTEIRGMALFVLAMTYAMIVTMQILAMWVMLASEKITTRYFISLGIVALMWIVFFMTVEMLEGTSSRYFFEGLIALVLPAIEGFMLLCGVLSLFRNMGYRLIRLPPNDFVERESQA